MRAHGPWKVHSTREVHRDSWLTLTLDDVTRPDGTPGTFRVIRSKPFVCVLALDDDGVVHLTEEFRYALGRLSLEVVGGGIDPGEEPLAAGKRELQEELGIQASEWEDLGTVNPFTSMVLAPGRLFLARGLRFGEHSPEGTELIRRVKMRLEEAVQAVLDGRITHGPSCVLILKASLRVQAERTS
jgi:ADP-ribose pyrophosphatase